MKSDDVRRYCLPCSADTGRLVARFAPALDARREKAAALRATKAQRKRAAERDRWIVRLSDANGVERELDVRVELQRALRDVGYFDGWLASHKPGIDDINVTLRRGTKNYHSGRAVLGGFDVWFTFGSGGSYEGGLELIYHEAAHMAGMQGDVAHGERFHRTLAEALQKRWPFITYGSIKPNQPGGCYAMGRRVVRQMEDHVRLTGSI